MISGQAARQNNWKEVREIKVINADTEQVIAENATGAYTFWTRLKGLMFTKSMVDETALHIAPCSSIHTFFMNYGIDILYLNKKSTIVGIEENLAPGKIGKRFPKTKSVIELPAGTIKRTSTAIGETVMFADDDTSEQGNKNIKRERF